MRVTFTANTDWYLHHFRLDLARAVVAAGHEVSMVCPDGPYVERLREAGFTVRTFRAPSDGFSLSANHLALQDITAAYRELRPELVHLFTPVCVLLGAIAARRCRVPYRVAALTGLGHVFTSESVKAKVARPGLRWLFRRELSRPGTEVIFQNEADMRELIEAGVVQPEHCHLIRGSGVDTERFRPREEPREGEGVRILFASRLLKEKGLTELVEAFRRVRREVPDAELWIAGERYAPNPTSLGEREVAALGRAKGVKLLGHVEDMAPVFAEVDIVALPSYREGTPKVLLEAAACGLPIVATDIPGCRGVVEEGESGYLVPVKAIEPLAERLLDLCGDADIRQRFGERGRALALNAFSSDRVIRETLAVYDLLIDHTPESADPFA